MSALTIKEFVSGVMSEAVRAAVPSEALLVA
jgi:hypothetical protein